MGIDWEDLLGIDDGTYSNEDMASAYEDSLPDDDYFERYQDEEDMDYDPEEDFYCNDDQSQPMTDEDSDGDDDSSLVTE